MPEAGSALRRLETNLVRESVNGFRGWSGDFVNRGHGDLCATRSAILVRTQTLSYSCGDAPDRLETCNNIKNVIERLLVLTHVTNAMSGSPCQRVPHFLRPSSTISLPKSLDRDSAKSPKGTFKTMV